MSIQLDPLLKKAGAVMARNQLPLRTLTVIAPDDGLAGQARAFDRGVMDSFHLTVLHGKREVHVIVTPNRSALRRNYQEASRMYFDDVEIAVPSAMGETQSYRGHGFISTNVTKEGAPTGKLTLTAHLHA